VITTGMIDHHRKTQAPPPPDAAEIDTEDDDPYSYPEGDADPTDANGAPQPLHDNGPSCFDCGGPGPADGMHWCLACRAAADQRAVS